MIHAGQTPDASSGMWGVIGMVVTLILAPIVTSRYVLKQSKAPEPEPMPEREQVERVSGISTAGVPDETVRLFAQLYNEVTQLRAREDRLEAKIRDLKKGVEDGRYPPWPDEDESFPS